MRAMTDSPRPQGFTTIELMSVVLIIGLLAVIAIPMYTNYSTRAKVSEVILAASRCRTHITEVFQGSTTGLPGANAWGCESAVPTSKFVERISTDANGVITVRTQNLPPDAVGTVTLRPIGAGVGTPPRTWLCGGTIPAKFRPDTCQN
jgi:type IV pilus assembly protein PilA